MAALIPGLLTAWILWLAPVPGLGADRAALALRDFTALWGAGRLALEGGAAALFDPALFTSHLRAWFGPAMPDQIWPYPPPILLLAAPLAWFPLPLAFVLYMSACLALFWQAMRATALPAPLRLAALASPAVAENLLIGQNGILTAGLLVGGLLLIDHRPVLAGMLLGLLVLKPQMGILLPFCFVAGRYWRVLASVTATAGVVILLSVLCFGVEAWRGYLELGRPAIAAYLERAWDADSPLQLFASAFSAARSLGMGLSAAYSVQAVTTLCCAAAATIVWRRAGMDRDRRMAVTVALTCAASPWIHAYDMPGTVLAIVVIAPFCGAAVLPILAFAWVWPGVLTLLPLPNALLILSTIGLAAASWRLATRTTNPLTTLHRCASSSSSP